MTARHQRLGLLALGVSGVAVAVSLALSAFNDSLVFFLSPTQIVEGEAPTTRRIRVGGLVEAGSLQRDADGLTTWFTITDTVHRVRVMYAGLLPDLFKEGRGCVAQGIVAADGTFHADLVLAKHDENYMPVEAAQSIEDAKRHSNDAAHTLAEP